MAIDYRSKDGETVDEIAWQFYGRADGATVQQIYDANPELIEEGPRLPAGKRVFLPAINPETDTPVRLWD